MDFVKALTPKETEEIKPGLFIQRTSKGYRQIEPAAWNGKINWKNLFGGKNFLRNFVWFAIIIFVAWSYFHDTKEFREFYIEVNSNPAEFCKNVQLININEIQITNSLQSNHGESPQISLES